MKPYLKLLDSIICRTPVFSLADLLNDRWDELKEIIKESSRDFYNLIEKLDAAQLSGANEKIRFSIWKYFNRARFRSTPFGSFAGLSFVSAAALTGPLILQDHFIKHRFTDWALKDSIDTGKPAWFLSNATYYLVGAEIRYIRFSGDVFELATLPVIAEIIAILSLCHGHASRAQICGHMQQQFGITEAYTHDLLRQLTDLQLLFSERSANITGAEYFGRLNITLPDPGYIIAERSVINGGFDTLPLGQMPEYFNFLRNFITQEVSPELEKFGSDFNKKFDLRAVPLALALDPETGVGYGEMAWESDDEMLSSIFGNWANQPPAELTFTYKQQQHFLLKGLLKGGPIKLEDYDGILIETDHRFPNTLSAIITYHNNQAVVESAGGCTANSLLGRFTLAGGEAFKLAKTISDAEINANPDILFFDVAYQAEKRIDNVNRRQQLYENELPLLSWSCVDEPLMLDDLLVMVHQGEIILWSKKYTRRVVPRIASAYNYNRSDLAVYRFLCDLQNQGLCTNLTFSFRQLLPGLGHYPRVIYKSLIVSPEMWKFNIRPDDLVQLKNRLAEMNINNCFKCGNADQTLCFDPAIDEDLNAFLIYIKQNEDADLYLTEALTGDVVSGVSGGKYIPQYIATYFHTQPVYNSHQPPVMSNNNHAYPPGNEWLYLEIYCRPVRSNIILLQIRRFLNEHRKQLKKWFFIRYSEPAPHIRLRLELKDRTFNGNMLTAINDTLAPLYKDGLIADIQVKTYNREAERYGPDRMELVEAYFYMDSRYTIKLLSHGNSTELLQLHTLQFMHELVQLANLEDEGSFVQAVADSFSREFQMGRQAFKQVNKSFETVKSKVSKNNLLLPANYKRCFTKVMNDCYNEAERKRILADLIHMHVNRVFVSEQRKQEALLYQYLVKWLKITQFREEAVRAR